MKYNAHPRRTLHLQKILIVLNGLKFKSPKRVSLVKFKSKGSWKLTKTVDEGASSNDFSSCSGVMEFLAIAFG